MRSIFTRQFVCRSSPVTIRGRKRRADGNLALGVDALESRMMLAITPGQLYTDATYTQGLRIVFCGSEDFEEVVGIEGADHAFALSAAF